MTEYKHVFKPIKIGNVWIKNRIEFSPAVPCLASPDGYVTRELIEFAKSLARGGPGIVNIGDTATDFEYGADHEAQINLGTDRIVTGLSELVEAVHRYGAKLSCEINHGGRNAPPQLLDGKSPLGPSPIPSKNAEMFADLEGRRAVPVKEMNHDDIEMVKQRYVDAVYRCMLAGFETVMLHGGHGHMLAQWLSPYSNRRTDAYGGSLEGRAKFPIEVLDAIRRKVGNNIAIEYRISLTEHVPGGIKTEEVLEFLKMIEDRIDLVHVSVGLLTDPVTIPHMIQPTYFPHAYNVRYAAMVKEVVKIPVVAVGSILDLATADRIIAEGMADMVAMARAQLADPEMMNKSRRGRLDEIRPCVRCNHCTHRVSRYYPIRCAVNPIIGREVEFGKLRPAEVKKKVVVVGGGPAGMEAAIVASERGHQVTLYEKADRLGGTLHCAAALPFKEDMKRYLDWLIGKTERSNIDIKYSTEATAATVKAEGPDVLIVAVGADACIPSVPGIDKRHVVLAADVATGNADAGARVVVAGGGMVGLETALMLAQRGKQVTVIDQLPQMQLAEGTPAINKFGLLGLLFQNGVQFRTEVNLEEITDEGVVVMDKKWQRHTIPADTVVLSLGYTSRSATVEALRGSAPDVYVVGDASKADNLMAAIHSAFLVAAEI